MRNLLIYQYISEVARSGSVRKAAEKLAITPSSLNRRIQSFEYEIGAAIFERNARGVRLNPAGELAVHTLRKHLADMKPDEAMEFLRKHMIGTQTNDEFLISMNS